MKSRQSGGGEPYLGRAAELDGHEPVIAYYCRMYSMDVLMKSRQSGGGEASAELNSLLMDTLSRAEASNKTLDLTDGPERVEQFALQVFGQVDSSDRAGLTDAGTAAQFYASSIFLDVCAQFYEGELPPDLQEKSRYAKFRAVQIRECIKQGLPPTLPPEKAAAGVGGGGGAAGADAAGLATPAAPPAALAVAPPPTGNEPRSAGPTAAAVPGAAAAQAPAS